MNMMYKSNFTLNPISDRTDPVAFIGAHASSSDYKEVCVWSTSYTRAQDIGAKWNRRSGVQFQKWPEYHTGPDVLIVIADAFTTPHSYGTYLLALARGHRVVAYGPAPEVDHPTDWK